MADIDETTRDNWETISSLLITDSLQSRSVGSSDAVGILIETPETESDPLLAEALKEPLKAESNSYQPESRDIDQWVEELEENHVPRQDHKTTIEALKASIEAIKASKAAIRKSTEMIKKATEPEADPHHTRTTKQRVERLRQDIQLLRQGNDNMRATIADLRRKKEMRNLVRCQDIQYGFQHLMDSLLAGDVSRYLEGEERWSLLECQFEMVADDLRGASRVEGNERPFGERVVENDEVR